LFSCNYLNSTVNKGDAKQLEIDQLLDKMRDFMERRERQKIEIPAHVISENRTMFVILVLTRNIFLLKNSDPLKLEALPNLVIEAHILNALASDNTCFEQFVVYKEYMKFYLDNECFQLAKYFLSAMKQLMANYQANLRSKYDCIDNAPTYDRDCSHLIFYDYHCSICLFVEELLSHHQSPAPGFDDRHGRHLLLSFAVPNFNPNWIPHQIDTLSDVERLRIHLEMSSKLSLAYLERQQSRFDFYRKKLGKFPRINQQRLAHLYSPSNLVNQKIYLECLLNYVRVLYFPNLGRNCQELAGCNGKLEALLGINRNLDFKL
jgi:hypothetical protein